MFHRFPRPIPFILCAVCCGIFWNQTQSGRQRGAHAADTAKPAASSEPTAADLKSQIEQLKTLVPDQAHAMKDVGDHFSNLWFAGDAENWPLAAFYLGESRSHLAWAVRLKPIRKDNAGRDIDLAAILQALENTPLKELDEAIKAEDKTAFSSTYRVTLEACYACHKASDKPYLRPQVPTQPESHVMNFDPKASWPQ